jgi:hypothetical protein
VHRHGFGLAETDELGGTAYIRVPRLAADLKPDTFGARCAAAGLDLDPEPRSWH